MNGSRPSRLGIAVTVAALLVSPGMASAADSAARWAVDLAKSRIVFVGRQMRVPTEGEFRRFGAIVHFDVDDLASSSAHIVIETASASSGNSRIDQELARDKWFAVDRFPTARFVTTGFRGTGGDGYEAAARLTLRDVTRDVVLPFVLKIREDEADPAKLVGRASGKLEIRRLQFGIGQAEWADTSIVADEVVIRIELLARREK